MKDIAIIGLAVLAVGLSCMVKLLYDAANLRW